MKGGLAFIDRPAYRRGCDQSPAGPPSWCFWFGRCYDDPESMGVQGAADRILDRRDHYHNQWPALGFSRLSGSSDQATQHQLPVDRPSMECTKLPIAPSLFTRL